ncbi:MAG: DUF4347 domain-containing protein [Pseudomonadota bacterium]
MATTDPRPQLEIRYSCLPLALERRVLLDAAAVATGMDAMPEADAEASRSAAAATDEGAHALLDALGTHAVPAGERREVVVIDASVPGQDALRASIADGVDVFVLDADQDGIAQIADLLARQSGPLDALHVISHGRDGAITLGNSNLSATNVTQHADELRTIGAAMSITGDLHLYGCNVSSSADGQQLATALAQLTGADVAASDDLTGGLALGGDWDLEHTVGAVETSLAVDTEALADFAHTLAGVPTATISTPGDVLLGEDFTFSVTFDNTSPTDTAFGPFLEVYVPTTGADGVYDAATDTYTSVADGLTVNSATYLGTNLTIQSVVLEDTDAGTAGIQFEHPIAVDTNGDPVVGTVPAGYAEGDTVLFIRLPFGSFAPDQPNATVEFNASMSNLADLGTAMNLTTRAGFEFGNTAVSDNATDPSIINPATSTAAVTPTLTDITVTYDGTEDESATGENFPQSFTINVNVANGQTITDLDITNLLPNNIQYLDSVVTGGGTKAVEPTTGAPQNAGSNELRVNFASLLGTASGSDATIVVNYFVPESDANGAAVLDPASGDDVGTGAEVSALGDFTPLDGRDSATGGTDNVSFDPVGQEVAFTAKAITVVEGVSVVNDLGATGATSGDTLEYTITFNVSDHFAFGNLSVTDLISDGQLFDSTFTPVLSVNPEGVGSTSGNFDSGNFTVTTNKDNDPSTNVAGVNDGTSSVVFDLSQQLAALAAANPGAGIDTSGRLIGGAHAGGTAGTGATTGTITFRTVIQESFTDAFPVGGDSRINENDTVNSNVTITGDVLDNSLNATGQSEDDNGSTSTSIVAGNFNLSVVALNGTEQSVTNIEPGDDVTFRLTYDLATGDFEDFNFTQFLSQPVFRAADANADGTPDTLSFVAGGGIPAVGTFGFGATHSADLTTNVPTVTPNATSNSLNFDFGTRQDGNNQPLTIDLLFTMKVSDDPFADGLLLTQLAQQSDQTTQRVADSLDSIAQLTFTQPDVSMTKGIVATDGSGSFNPGNVGPSGVAFNPPGTAGAAFTGTISSSGLESRPVDSNLTNVDGGDFVRMAIVIENKGSSADGAFDINVKDLIPTGFEAVEGQLNLKIHNGAGTELTFADPGGGPVTDAGGGLFTATGLTINDGATGALTATSTSSGTNIAIINYDLRATTAIEAQSTATAAATLANYAGVEGGADFTPTDLTDDVELTSPTAAITSEVIATNQAHTTGNNVTIGETVTVRTTITVPEGTSTSAQLVELLDPGLAVVSVDSVTASSGLATSIGSFNDVATNASIGDVSGAAVDAGRQITLDFGTVTNSEDDGGTETIVVEYTAIVLNATETQNAGTNLNSQATWTSTNTNISDTTDNVSVVEPQITVAHSVTPDNPDAGDTVTYTITLTNTNDADAFDVDLSNVIPSDLTIVGGTLQNTGGTAPTSLSESGGTVTANFATLAKGATSTITFQATVDNTVTPGQVLPSDANVTWSTLTGVGTNVNLSTHNTLSDERTGNTGDEGGALNDLSATDPAPLTIQPLDPVVSLVNTSESGTAGSDLAVGEIARVRVELRLGELTANNLELRANLPAGLQYLDDGTTNFAFISTSGSSIVSTDTALNSAGVAGDETTLSSITPATALPGGNIGSGPFSSGTDPVFSFGTVTNLESDTNAEFVVVEFNARVLNESGVDNGDTLDVTADVFVSSTLTDSSNTLTTTVREPVIDNLTKQVTSTDGSTVTYTVTYSNTGNATAHEVQLLDTLNANLTNLSVSSITRAGGATGETDATAGTTLDVTIDEVPVGGSVTVVYTADVVDPTLVVADDAADITYTSLDGTGTGLGSSTHGTAGSSTGERTGSGAGENDLNDSSSVGLGVISGTLFEDVLSNQSQDAGEQSLSGVGVNVTWFGNDGVEGGGDDVTVATTTDGSGNFSVGALPPGTYKITVPTAPAGFSSVFDPEGSATDASATVTLGNAATLADQDFGFLGPNEAPSFTGLDATPNYDENDPAFVIDANATIADPELDIIGNYGGATLTVSRNGGAAAQDLFANSGNLAALTEGGNLTLNGTNIGNVTTNSGGTLVLTFNSTATPANVDEVLQSLTYENSSDDPPASVTLDYVINDGNVTAQGSGGALTGTGSVTIAINQINDAPVFANLAGDAVTFTENGSAVLLDNGGDLTITDPDSPDFDGGVLTVSVVGGADTTEDLLGVRNQGTGAGQIGVSGANITFAGTVIGTFSGGSGGTALTVNLNASASLDAVQALVRNLNYDNADTVDPDTAPRTVRVSLTDGDGGSTGNADITVNVQDVNEAPAFASLDNTVAFSENGSAQAIDADATISDEELDGFGNYNGATLTIARNGGAQGEDVFANTGNLAALTQGGNLTLNGADIGTVTTNSGGTLVLTFNGSATPANVDEVLQSVTYENTSEAPPASIQLDLTISDQNSGNQGSGGVLTDTGNVTVNITRVNDAPAFTGLDGTPTFTEDNAAVQLDANATIADPELDGLGNYDGATLTLVRNGGANGEDVFSESGNLGVLTQGGNLTLNGTTIGTVTTNSGGTLVLTFNASATPSNVDEVLQSIAYSNTSDTPPANVQIDFTVNDGNTGAQGTGGALQDSGSVTVSITPTNDAPVIGNLDGDVLNYVEDSGAVVIDQGTGVTLADPDSADFNGGTLTVAITAGGDTTEDVVSVRNQGTGAGQIGVSGSDITFGGTVIGSFTGGSNGNNFVVNLNGNATPAAVEALLANLTYENTDTADPTTTPRNLAITVTDGDGGTSAASNVTVNVQDVNTAPTITNLDSTPTFVEDAAAVVLDTDATIADEELDAFGNYNGATLTIGRNGGANGEDVFSESGNLAALTEGGNLTLNGTNIGTVTTNSGGSLVLTFNASATPGNVDEVLQSIAYSNTNDTPPANVTLDVNINDRNSGDQGSGGQLDQTASITVSITPTNDAPVHTSIDGDTLSYNEGDGEQLLDQGSDATLVDPDSSDFDGGELRVSVQSGGDNAEDVYGIRDEGTGAGQIGVSGSDITFGGTVIGTFTGGTNGNDLVVSFDSDATPAAVQALIRNLSYTNTDTADPTTGARQLNLTVTDGDGGTSTTANLTVNVQDVNEAPVFTNLDNTPTFNEDTGAVVLDGDAVVADEELDAFGNYDGATLTINRNGGANGDDVFSESGNLAALTQGGNLTLNGTNIGTVTTNSAGTLVLTFNASATPANVDEVLQSIAYSNTNNNPAASVTLDITLNDQNSGNQGSGGALSDTESLTVNISPRNDAPTFTGLDNSPAFTEQGAPVVLDSNAVIADPELDSIGNYGGATLTINRQGGANGDDIFGNTGNLAVLTEGGNLTLNGTVIGTVTTNSGGTLVLTFNNTATPANVDEVLQSLTYDNDSDNPGPSIPLEVTINDGNTGGVQGTGGAREVTGVITVGVTEVNDPPVAGGLDTDVLNYTEGDGQALIDQGADATFTDVDSADLNGGTLTVSVTGGGDAAEDVYSIRNVGNGAGQIGFDGTNVTFGGVVIGTVTGGSGGTDLVVTFNANSTPEAVQALMRNLSYENTDNDDPTAGARTIDITVTDGDGGTTAASSATINVTPVNDPPTLTAIPNQTLDIDESTGALPFTLGDPETLPPGLTLTVTSSNQTLVPAGNITISGTGANRTISVSPTAGLDGVTTITLTLSDGVLTTTQTFNVTVQPLTIIPPPSDAGDPPDDGDAGDPPDPGADGGFGGAGGAGAGGLGAAAGGAGAGGLGAAAGGPGGGAGTNGSILDPSTLADRANRDLNLELYLDGELQDRFFETDDVRFEIPESAFQTSGENEIVEWQVKQTDGADLPQWLKFNPETLTFTGVPPKGEPIVLDIVVRVRDDAGNDAKAEFKLTVVPTDEPAGDQNPGGGQDDGDQDDSSDNAQQPAGDGGQQTNAGEAGGKPALTAQLGDTGTPALEQHVAALLAALTEAA